jgi:hypothetical protein
MSKFEINNKAGRGRPPGSPNKVSATAKEFLQLLSDELRETILNDISLLDPIDRVKLFIQLQEFLIPKLARKQIEAVSEGDKIEYIITVVEGKENLPFKPA